MYDCFGSRRRGQVIKERLIDDKRDWHIGVRKERF